MLRGEGRGGNFPHILTISGASLQKFCWKLHKLANVGTSSPIIKWFESYVSIRNQIVRISSSYLSQLPVTHGVPQGAVFSPLLFCIYMDDLPSITPTCQLESYVDDSKLLLSFLIEDANRGLGNMQQNLLEVARWFCEHKHLINPSKTKFLIIRETRNRNDLWCYSQTTLIYIF